MTKIDTGMIKEIEGNVERFTGKKMADKVMEGSEQISSSTSKIKIAEWVKEAIGKLDKLADKKTRNKIMENCGYNCSIVNKRVIEKAKARREKYKSIDEFIEAEERNPMAGTRIKRDGNILYQFYAPQSYTRKMRCFCSLLRRLPADERVSITYCQCSKGFVKKFWEGVLEKPVRVEIMQSVVSGAPECKFKIYL